MIPGRLQSQTEAGTEAGCLCVPDRGGKSLVHTTHGIIAISKSIVLIETSLRASTSWHTINDGIQFRGTHSTPRATYKRIETKGTHNTNACLNQTGQMLLPV